LLLDAINKELKTVKTSEISCFVQYHSHTVFDMSLLLDYRFQPATPLVHGPIDEALRQRIPLLDDCTLELFN